MSTKIQLRRDTKANWENVNPILGNGEIVLITDTNELVVGDGVKRFIDCPRLNNTDSNIKFNPPDNYDLRFNFDNNVISDDGNYNLTINGNENYYTKNGLTFFNFDGNTVLELINGKPLATINFSIMMFLDIKSIGTLLQVDEYYENTYSYIYYFVSKYYTTYGTYITCASRDAISNYGYSDYPALKLSPSFNLYNNIIHLSLIYNGQNFESYVNGFKLHTYSVSSYLCRAHTNPMSSYKLRFGLNGLSGGVSNVIFYNRTLTSDEIYSTLYY